MTLLIFEITQIQTLLHWMLRGTGTTEAGTEQRFAAVSLMLTSIRRQFDIGWLGRICMTYRWPCSYHSGTEFIYQLVATWLAFTALLPTIQASTACTLSFSSDSLIWALVTASLKSWIKLIHGQMTAIHCITGNIELSGLSVRSPIWSALLSTLLSGAVTHKTMPVNVEHTSNTLNQWECSNHSLAQQQQ